MPTRGIALLPRTATVAGSAADNPGTHAGIGFGYISRPMPAILRSLLIWLMVLAIPNQGLAASFMQHCAPAGSPASTVAVAAPSAQGHDRARAAQHAGHDAAHAAHGSEHAGAGGANPAHGNSAEAAGTCSVCAACCHAIGMPPSPSAIAQAPDAAQVLQPAVMDVESFVPGGLDRPPRTPPA